MAESRKRGSTLQLDMERILLEAQHRWLRPAEICEILRNYQKFRIAPEPPNKPPSGSLFLFDRKALRYFRKDGHNWRKKKDGKTVKEAHEKLKAESVDVLHCYYAHGEDNENFQRRSYWLLEEDLMHIVLVHYLQVKDNRTSFSRARDAEEIVQTSNVGTPTSSNSFTNQNPSPSRAVDAESANSSQASEYEDSESDNCQASSRYYPFPALQQHDDRSVRDFQPSHPSVPVPSLHNQSNRQIFQGTSPQPEFYSVAQEEISRVLDESGLGFTFSGSQSQFDLASWEEVLEHSATGFQDGFFQPSLLMETATAWDISERESSTVTEDLAVSRGGVLTSQGKTMSEFPSVDVGAFGTPINDAKNGPRADGSRAIPPLLKQLSHIEGDSLKKNDSFSRWMSKELGQVDDCQLNPSSTGYWNSVESGGMLEDPSSQGQLGEFFISPSLSEDQLFSIDDFSPTWAYSGSNPEVLISGTFLKSRDELANYKWSCMFGEIEVPADVVADGVLRCHVPTHKIGRVPFYITGSNRLACSEVREFEFRINLLLLRFERMLCVESVNESEPVFCNSKEQPCLSNENGQSLSEISVKHVNIFNSAHETMFFSEGVKDQSMEEQLKEKLRCWLLNKVAEDGKGPCVLDSEGQGVLHLAAALGYDWAIEPTTNAGVNINFRDVQGWTALHWAACCGRERTVVFLVSLSAAPGALTDPTPDFPAGRTPADLASMNGHKGIAGFLAEASLTSHLSTLTLKDSSGIDLQVASDMKSVDDVVERNSLQLPCGDIQAGLSLKDSLSAVRNAAQAAARIHQVFRVHSFQRKKLSECDHDTHVASEERALSFISVKAAKGGQHDIPVHVAAIKIQNKFRGWKGRREFLITRQRIVKIQAHVRGHQVRKHYKRIIWTVGIVEKVILRWRRKKSGLRGFRSEGLIEGPSVQNQPSADDYDFLKEGRKQTEVRLEKALARVKSMVQYPEARDQYQRLLTIVSDLQESKVMQDDMNESEEATDGDFVTELEELCEDDDALFLDAR